MNLLRNELLADLSNELAVPHYDRDGLTPGIVHIGMGHFHRAHQAMYLDRLLQMGLAGDWAIWGVSMRSTGANDSFAAQDHLYTLTEKRSDGTRASRVIGSIVGFESAPDNLNSVLERIAAPSTRIVSLTITEGGYGIDPATRQFTGVDDPRVAYDLDHPGASRSWLGLLLNAFRLRRDRSAGPITVLSCDNIEDNGRVAEHAFTTFAELVDPEMSDWVARNVTFPGSMVDRVVPATTAADDEYLARRFGIRDDWAVTSEPFVLWTVEDNFANGRPPLELVGVDLVSEVAPYERMKLRLANGVHQGLCYFGRLLDYEYVHEAVSDPDINALLLRYIDEEAVPSLTPIDGVDFNQWGRQVLSRFGNPQLDDRISRICADSSDRIPKFVLPVVADRLRDGGTVDVCAAIVASWARYAQGVDERRRPIDVVDPRRERVMEFARMDLDDPGAFLTMREVFDQLGDSDQFVAQFVATRTELNASGARKTLIDLGQASEQDTAIA